MDPSASNTATPTAMEGVSELVAGVYPAKVASMPTGARNVAAPIVNKEVAAKLTGHATVKSAILAMNAL